MMEAGLHGQLVGDDAVAASAATRIYPVNLPENVDGPSVTFRVISKIPDYTLDGATGMITARVQIDAWAAVYGDAKQLAQAIHDALNDFSGTFPDGTAVQNVWLADAATDGFDADARLYRVQADYRLIYSE
jgi:hypothetical protein